MNPAEQPLDMGKVSLSKTLAGLLPPALVSQLAKKAFGREATAQDIRNFLSPFASPPSGLDNTGATQFSESSTGASLVAPNHDWARVFLAGTETLHGYFARPLGLPVYYGLYQSSRWESGGWDGYNIDVVSMAFLTLLRCDPKPGSDRPFARNLALLGHYHFDGSLNDRKAGSPIQARSRETLLVGVAASVDELSILASAMNITGYGQRACTLLVESLPLTLGELSDLLNPAYCEREILSEVAPAVPRAPRRQI